MTVLDKPDLGQLGWGDVLNAALDQLVAAIDAETAARIAAVAARAPRVGLATYRSVPAEANVALPPGDVWAEWRTAARLALPAAVGDRIVCLGTAFLDNQAATSYFDWAVVHPQTNLMASDAAASFEDGTMGGWTAQGNVTGINTAAGGAVDGAKATSWTVGPGGIVGAAGLCFAAPVATPGAGIQRLFSVSVKPTAAVTLRASLQWDNAGVFIANSFQDHVLPANVWTRIWVAGVSPANTTRVYPKIDAGGALPAGTVVYVDAAQLEQAAAPASLFHLPSGTILRRFGGAFGSGFAAGASYQAPAPSAHFTVAAGDLVGGNVTLAQVWRVNGARNLLLADYIYGLRAMNLGP